jgi:quinol monooxygenase YgiN
VRFAARIAALPFPGVESRDWRHATKGQNDDHAMVRFRVADYDAWRPQYDGAMERGRGVIHSYRVWRGQDDRNLVFTEETFESREAAEALLASPAIQQEMKEHGVDASSVQFDWLDEVGGETL